MILSLSLSLSFSPLFPSKLHRRILHSPAPIPSDLSLNCQRFIRGLLHKNPGKRLGSTGAAKIKQHPWFQVAIPYNSCPHGDVDR